jgi:hypothetical protein
MWLHEIKRKTDKGVKLYSTRRRHPAIGNQVGIEPDRVRQAFNHHMQMKSFHAITFFRLDIPANVTY